MKNSKVTKAKSTKQGMNLKKKARRRTEEKKSGNEEETKMRI